MFCELIKCYNCHGFIKLDEDFPEFATLFKTNLKKIFDRNFNTIKD